MRVFITGVSGYLGSFLAEYLSEFPEVETITGISRTPPRQSLPPKVEFIPMDIRSPEIAGAIVGHDVLLHAAFMVFWTAKCSPAERDEINLYGIRNVAWAARQAGVQRFIHCSSIAAYDNFLASGREGITEEWPIGIGNSSLYYPNGKALAERVMTETLDGSDIPLTIFRPSFIIGPHDRTYIPGVRQNPIRYPGRNPRIQYIHEDDLGDAFLQAMRTDLPGAYNLVPDDCLRWSEILEILGVKLALPFPSWLVRGYMGFRWRYLGDRLHPDWYDTMLFDWVISNSKLRETGWAPRFSSADALRSALTPV